MRKSIKILSLSLAAVCLLAALAAGIKYWTLPRESPEAVASKVSLTPDSKIVLGDTVSASASIKCPWNRRPISAQLSPGNGTQPVGKPQITRKSTGWGSWEWTVTAEIQPFINGETEAGKLSVEMNAPVNTGSAEMMLEIPAFTSAALDTGTNNELSVAGKISPKAQLGRRYYIIAAAVAALALALAAFLFWKSRARRAAPSLTPWEIAIIELQKLRDELKNKGGLGAMICVVKLSDIVRDYIQRRFSIHATAQTTYEFLLDLGRPGSPLPEQHKDFLKEFMQASDLVKFANLPADIGIVENAVSKAEDLVKSTTPPEVKK